MLILTLIIILIAVALPSVQISITVLIRTTTIILIFSAVIALNTINNIVGDINIYNGLIHITSTTLSIQTIILVLGSLAIIPWGRDFNKINEKNTKTQDVKNYGLFVVFTTIGGMCLVSSADLITVYLAIELQSFAVYIIASVLSRESEKATQASLLYFILGGLSSSIILLGSAILYKYTGHTSLEAIYNIVSVISYNNYEYMSAALGVTLITVGFLFKITAAPFHNWGPDVYDNTPTISATWLAVVPKISILGFIINLQSGEIIILINGVYYNTWVTLILLTSFLSLIIGTIVGLSQNSIKRLIAYSTISHVGFLLLSLAVYSEESVEAFLFYILQYSFTTINLFIIVLAIGYILNPGESYKNSDINKISEITGIFKEYPLLSFSIAICLLSIAGIPPLVGFYGKQAVLYSAIHANYIFIAIIGIIVSIISTSYYLRIVRIVHFDEISSESKTLYEEKISKYLIEGISLPKHYSYIYTGTKVNVFTPHNNIIIPIQQPITNIHSYIISIITTIIIFFIISPDFILNSVRLLALNIYSILLNFMSLFIYIIFTPILTIILLIVNILFSISRPDSEKNSIYECGYSTIRGQTRAPFTISYYLVAVLFLAFDVEVALLHPYAPSANIADLYGFWIVVGFFIILTLGFVVEIASGVLYFTDQRSALNHITLKNTS